MIGQEPCQRRGVDEFSLVLLIGQRQRAFLSLLIKAAMQAIEDPQSIIPNFYYVLAHLPTEYQKLSIEGQKKMMRIVAKEVRLDMLSAHLFRLYIAWENG